MRTAQYVLPRAEGDPEDGSLVVFYFGAGQGGSTQANLDRWIGQMEQPDGTPSTSKARTEKLKVGTLPVTILDVSGTFTGEMSPGSGVRNNQSNYRMQAAVIETPGGPYFVKLVGPQKTLAKWEREFRKFIESAEFR
jgi:hypothetical protein